MQLRVFWSTSANLRLSINCKSSKLFSLKKIKLYGAFQDNTRVLRKKGATGCFLEKCLTGYPRIKRGGGSFRQSQIARGDGANKRNGNPCDDQGVIEFLFCLRLRTWKDTTPGHTNSWLRAF